MRYILTALFVLALVITSRAAMSYLTSPSTVIAISDNEGQTIQGGQNSCT